MGSAVVLILVLAASVITYYARNKKFRGARDDSSSGQAHTTFANAHRNPPSSYGSFRRMPSYSLIDERSKDLQERIAELTIQR